MTKKSAIPASEYGAMAGRPAFCQQCPIARVTRGYVPPLHGDRPWVIVAPMPGDAEIETGIPLTGGPGTWVNNLLSRTHQSRSDFHIINIIGCQTPGNVFPSDPKWRVTSRPEAYAALTHCYQHHLQPTLDYIKPERVLALGEHALQRLTGKRGILVWRGSPLPMTGQYDRARVIATLDPHDLMIDYAMVSVAAGDYKKLPTLPPEHYDLYATAADLTLVTAPKISFDFEWDHTGAITLCGLTWKMYQCMTGTWNSQSVPEYKRIFESATDLIGHNIIGADTRYFEKFGWNITARLHDTMLKQHLIQPNMKHGLNFVASVFTNKVFWKGKGKGEEDEHGNIVDTKVQWKTWNQTDAIPRHLGGYGGCKSDDEAYRLYNARDTDASYQINEYLDLLLRQYKLEDLYWNVQVPSAFIARDMSARGLKLDTKRVQEIRTELLTDIARLEQTLPEGLRPYEQPVTKQIDAPPNTYKQRNRICKGTKHNPHDPVTLTFQRPGSSLQCSNCAREYICKTLPTVKRIKIQSTKTIVPWSSPQQVTAYAKTLGLKPRFDRKRGSDSADALARKTWGRTFPQFRILDQIKELATLRSNFAKETLQGLDRMYFNLLVHGTSEGRWSSTGQRKGIDLNIQNQPKGFRKIYIPEQPDWVMIEEDYSQGENMLTAHLARDIQRLERLQIPGYSEHLELAKLLFELPPDITKKQASSWCARDRVYTPKLDDGGTPHCHICGTPTQDLYGVGKVCNHGGNYGMTHIKLKETLDAEGFFYSEADCKRFVATRELLNPGTTEWQRCTIASAKQNGFLRNPFGRMIWLSTRDIATKALAFLPASTLADIIIRAMIGHYPERFEEQCYQLKLARTASMVPEWIMSIQVHDALVLQGPAAGAMEQARRTQAIMCQPWPELDNFSLGVEVTMGAPGASWGELKPVHI